jgi:hypothetical protein
MTSKIRILAIGFFILLSTGCASVEQKKDYGNIESPIIKHDLNGMTDTQIKDYFNQCVSDNLIFLYRGGFTGWYLVEDLKKNQFVKNMKWVGIGCTGGVKEGYKFNRLMLDYFRGYFKTQLTNLKCPYHNVALKEVPIIYGLPSKEAVGQAKNGEIILGGCFVFENQPKTGYICPVDKMDFSSYINTFAEQKTQGRAINCFPGGIFDKKAETDNFISQWYNKQLKALGEPALYQQETGKDKLVFRFLWLRTFHNPISIRLEINKNDGSGILYVKVTDGAGGYEPGKIKEDFKKSIPKEEIDKFLKLVKTENYWELPVKGGITGLDGAQWVVEGSQEGRYHVIDRWSPPEGASIKKIGLFLLNLSGLKVEDIY